MLVPMLARVHDQSPVVLTAMSFATTVPWLFSIVIVELGGLCLGR